MRFKGLKAVFCLLSCVMLFSAAQPAEAKSMEELFMESFMAGLAENAMADIIRIAALGDTDAQFLMGVMYAHGRGVEQDYAEAAKWYRLAAEQGHGGAANNLGELYFQGNGVRQDYRRAADWYRKAADQGIAAAESNLGALYYTGNGVRRDYAEALKWFRKAAAQGDADAQLMIGAMYDNGEGVKRDYSEAAAWYLKAAEQGQATAANNLGVLYGDGNGVKQDYKTAYMWMYLAYLLDDEESASKNLDYIEGKGLFNFKKLSQSGQEAAKAEAERKYEEIKRRKDER